MQFGYARGIHIVTSEEYRTLAEDTRIAYDMTPEEYLAGKGLNIKIEIL